MWIVRLALRRPYTFTVMAILIVVMGRRHEGRADEGKHAKNNEGDLHLSDCLWSSRSTWKIIFSS